MFGIYLFLKKKKETVKFYFRWIENGIREDFKVITKFPLLSGTHQSG